MGVVFTGICFGCLWVIFGSGVEQMIRDAILDAQIMKRSEEAKGIVIELHA